jgi:iron complex transport system permease protein
MGLATVTSPHELGTVRTRSWWRAGAVALSLLAGLVVLVGLSALVGSHWLPPAAVFAILVHQASGGWLGSPCGGLAANPGQCTVWTEVVWSARVPTILVALLCGAALALSGGTLQGTFRNPLCDPFLLGLSSGAAMGTSILFTFQVALSYQATLLPLFAFAGALLPGMVVYVAAHRFARNPEALVLTGVALSAFFSALLATFLFLNPSGGLQVSFWLLGNLQGQTWTRAGILAATVLIGGSLLALYGRELNVLQLGPEVAESVGVEARRTTRRLILLSTIVTAVAVAFTGVIGFVGLVSPHVVRLLVGPDYRRVLPLSALFGAVFLLGASDLAQVILPQIFLPVGIPTSFAGVPFFLYLLYRPGSRAR